MLHRVDSMSEYFKISPSDRKLGESLALIASQRANHMTALQDYQALAAILLHFRPRQIFEIGTYLGVTSDFFLNLLPNSTVTSVAYIRPFLNVFRGKYNNSELSKDKVGSFISPSNKSRFHQMYGNSHDLNPEDLIAKFGYFDLIFVDGDHSRRGVRLDTELAMQIISESGTICWHDANPKAEYLSVQQYLESELPFTALATADKYIGGIACWNRALKSETS